MSEQRSTVFVVVAAIAQDPALGSNVHEFWEGYLLEPLGMSQATFHEPLPAHLTYRASHRRGILRPCLSVSIGAAPR